MKKLYLLLPILFLIYWGCEDEKDTTPTEVTLWGVVYSVEDTDSLYLPYSGLTGEIPPEIGNLTNLTVLGLMSNQLSGEIPESICDLTNLTYLNLYYNQLTGSIPPEIGNLTNLTYLSLSNNQLTGNIPESICELTNLTWYSGFIIPTTPNSSIGNNQLCPPYPECIEDYVGVQDTSDCD